MTERTERIVDALEGPGKRAAARDLVSYLQCFDDAGKPLFAPDEIRQMCEAVGRMALRAAEKGDDRTLKRMLDAQLKLAGVNAKLAELDKQGGELDDILARLRERQRAASLN